MFLPTWWSDFGSGISFLQRSREARMQEQLQLVEEELNEAIIQLVEMKDEMNLSTTQKSDDGGWMKDYLRLSKATMQEQQQLVEMKLREAARLHQLVEKAKSDRMNLSTTRWSVYGSGMRSFLRSKVARMQKQLQLVENKKSDRMNLSTTWWSVYGSEMSSFLRSREARMQKQLQLVENKSRKAVRLHQLMEMKKSDWMNLSTTQKSDDGGWMKDYLRSREDRMQEQLQLVEEELNEAIIQLVQMKKSDRMTHSTTWWSVYGSGMSSFLRSKVARMQKQLQLVKTELRKAVRLHQLVEMEKSDWMNLSTTRKSDDGGWMKDYLRSREDRMQQLLQFVEMKLSKAIIQLVEMNDRMNLSTSQKSHDGGWIKDYLRSKVARMQKQLQLVEMEKSDWMNLSTTRWSVYGSEMSSFLRLSKAIIQFVEMNDWMNLSTTRKSDDGGWMKDYLRSKVARMQEQQQLVENNDWMNLSTTQKSDDGGWMKDYLSPELQRPDRSKVKAPRERNRSSLESVRIKHRSMEHIIAFQEEPSSPWDVMNLPTALQAVVGGGM